MMTIDENRVLYVISVFKDMGASEKELAKERHKLLHDPNYYKEWCGDIQSWCCDSPSQ